MNGGGNSTGGVTLTITLVNGQVSINGPISDKVLCYGLLELAKDALREYNTQAQRRIIAPPPPGIVP